MEPNFMGKEGFTWAVGVVENRFDPLYLGRCKVRWLGWHTKDKQDLPTDALPWAFPLMPLTSASQTGVGTSPTGPVEGSWIMGFFRDGEDASDPVMLGTLPGRPDLPCNPDEGFNDPRDWFPTFYDVDELGNIRTEKVEFTNVPQHPLKVEFDTEQRPPFPAVNRIKIFERSDKATKVVGDEIVPESTGPGGEGTTPGTVLPDYEYSYNYPLERFLGEPTTPRLARGFADKSTRLKSILGTNTKSELIIKDWGDNNSIVQTKMDLRMGTAWKAKGVKSPNTFREPEPPYDATYPYNHVHVSESGHAIEIDDTPSHERLHWYHRSGSYREMHPQGTIVDKSNEDYWSCVLRNSYEHIAGDKFSTIHKGYELMVNADHGTDDYWLRVKGSGDVHMESESGNIEMYCRDGIAFIKADRIEFNAKEEIVMNTKKYTQGETVAEEPSRHGGPMNPDPEGEGLRTYIKRSGHFHEDIIGERAINCGKFAVGSTAAMALSAQNSLLSVTHRSEEVITGANVLTGDGTEANKISVTNGIINIRSGGIVQNGGCLLQLNAMPSASPVNASGYLSIMPIGPQDPSSAKIKLASQFGPVTMANKLGEISIAGKNDGGSVLMSTNGPQGEAKMQTATAEMTIDAGGTIAIKNQIISLRRILDEFMQDYLNHSHAVVGATNTGSLMPGAMAKAQGTSVAPEWIYNAVQAIQSQKNLNLLLAD